MWCHIEIALFCVGDFGKEAHKITTTTSTSRGGNEVAASGCFANCSSEGNFLPSFLPPANNESS